MATPSSTLRRSLLASLAAIMLGVTLVVSFPAPADAASYKIVNTGGVGVRQRHNPTINSSYSGVAPEGATITVNCQTWSEPVGSYGNRLWLKVSRSGTGLWWIADTYTNSPRKASDGPLAGIPMCGSTSSVPGPSSSYPSLMKTSGKYRFCTNTALAGCVQRSTIAAGTGLKMHCWIDDSTVTESYKSNRWFYVTSRDGVRGFVHSSRVEKQTSVPNCSQHRGIAASRWAAAKVGSTTPTTAEKSGNPTMDRWSGWCYVFAFDAFKFSTGVQPKSGHGSAKNTFYAYQREGKVSTNLNHGSINIGSIVFWTSGTYGHAAIYVGQGQVATTRGDGSTKKAIEITPMSTFGTPSGWVSPNNV